MFLKNGNFVKNVHVSEKTNSRFDQDAASWDAKEYRIKMAGNVTEAIRNEVILNSGMDLMDFGCGTGLVSLPMAAEAGSLSGVDNSAGMLEVFLTKAAEMNLPNVKSLNLNLGDGDTLPGSYDLILSSMAFHHVKDISSLIRLLVDALNPGGYLCIADLDSENGLFHADNTGVYHFGFDRENMMELFRLSGLNEVRACTASNMPRTGNDGVERDFPIFLITGVKQ